MIPDFKTFITESLWSDMQRRAEGSDKRIEDDIDFFDSESFIEYIESIYNYTSNDPIKTENNYINDMVIVYPFYDDSSYAYPVYLKGFKNNNETHIYVYKQFLSKKGKDIYKILSDNYTIVDTSIIFHSSPKKEKELDMKEVVIPNNTKTKRLFFIKLIDFLLDNIEAFPQYKKNIEKRESD